MARHLKFIKCISSIVSIILVVYISIFIGAELCCSVIWVALTRDTVGWLLGVGAPVWGIYQLGNRHSV